MSSTEGEADLRDLIRAEMLNIPLAQWGFFFPIHAAVWRFMRTISPSLLGELNAGYDGEPYFKGQGADWFIENITNNPRYIDLAEDIMYNVTSGLPPAAFDRGFVLDSELLAIDSSTVDELRSVITGEAQKAAGEVGFSSGNPT